jgi:phage terminase large subunit-like protein
VTQTMSRPNPASQRSTVTKTSRRSVSRPEPNTIEHFRAYCELLRLDNGESFVLEGWQEAFAGDLFAGFSQLWLVVPEGNGKTTLLAAIALYHGDYTPSAFVPIGAASREQAEILYRQAEGFVFRTPGLRDRFKCQEGYRRIKCLRTGGRIQVYAADDRTADGVIPTLAMLDELHRHRTLKLLRTWLGKLLKRAGQLVAISTAGEPGSEFEETRSRIRKMADRVTTGRGGCYVRAESEDIVLHDFSVPEGKSDDMGIVALANPREDITAEVLRQKRASPTMTVEHWRRFVCNIATLTGGSAISPEEWDALEESPLVLPDGCLRLQQVDLGWKIDTTALSVLVWESSERRIVTGVQILQPPVDESGVVAGILRNQIDYDANMVVLDPSAGGEQMVQLLEKGLHPLQTDDEVRLEFGLPPLDETEVGALEFVAHSQDNAPMSQAASRLDEAIRNGWIVHDGDRALRSHVLNAIAKPLGDGKFKYDRPADAKGERRKHYPIDGLTGLLMGNNVASDPIIDVAANVW